MYVYWIMTEPPDMPRNVSVIEETPHGVVLFAGKPVPRRPDELPMTKWKITYERASRHGEEKTLKFKLGMYQISHVYINLILSVILLFHIYQLVMIMAKLK